MSRRAFPDVILLGAFLCVSLGSEAVFAQQTPRAQGTEQSQTPPVESDAVIAQNLLQATQKARCGVPAADGSIVVCGGREASEKERLPLRDELESAHSTRDGLPRAPNVSGLADCSKGCIGFGSVPPPMYYFDIAALPLPPEGSDADRIAKGEIRAP